MVYPSIIGTQIMLRRGINGGCNRGDSGGRNSPRVHHEVATLSCCRVVRNLRPGCVEDTNEHEGNKMKREERKCVEKQRKSVSFILFKDGESLGDVATGLIFCKTCITCKKPYTSLASQSFAVRTIYMYTNVRKRRNTR